MEAELVRAHAPIPPSSLDALSVCNAYQSAGDEEPSEAAASGTRQHRALELHLNGRPEWQDGLSPDEIEQVDWAAQFVDAFAPAERRQTEQRVTVLDENLDPLTWGTADVLTVEPLSVFDYKSGLWRPHLYQLYAYGLGAMQKYGQRECRIALLWGQRQKVNEYILSEAEALQALTRLFADIRAHRHLRVSEYCKWCANRSDCPLIAQRGNALVHGREDWKDVSDWQPATWHPSQVTQPEDMRKLLEVQDALEHHFEEWSKSVDFHAKRMLRTGAEIEGWKLSDRSQRPVENLLGAFQASGLSAEEFLTCCSVSLDKLKAAYRAKRPLMKKAAAEREMLDLLDPYLAEPTLSTSVRSERKKAQKEIEQQ